MVSLKYDKLARVFYVRIRRGKVAKTEPLNDSVFLDLNAKGKLLGIEVVLPKDTPEEMIRKVVSAAV